MEKWKKRNMNTVKALSNKATHDERADTKSAFLLRNYKIGFLNPKDAENRFCVSLLNRSIQDRSDHDTSKEPKNPLQSGFFGSFDAP